MNLQLKILESDSQIAKSMLNALAPQLDKLINKCIPLVESSTRSLIRTALMDEPEYQSLKSGKLKYEFGLPSSVSIDNIVEIFSNSVNMQIEKSKINNSNIVVNIKLTALDKTGEPAISSDDAFVHDIKGEYSLPWLEWLLFKGMQPIVKNYAVKMGANKFSRSGMAIMVESKKNWRVPNEFAGNISNNWLSRAIDKIEDKIQQNIISIFNK